METKPEEVVDEVALEAVEETVGSKPEEVVEEEVAVEDAVEAPSAEGPKANVMHEAHEVLRAWKKVYEVEKPQADDTLYYAEELWREDKKFWDQGKLKFRRGEWTVETFERELEALTKKQQPVWDKLLKRVDTSIEKLEQPIEDVKASEEKVMKSIGPHPAGKLLGKPAPTAEEAKVRHEYHYKLQHEFKDAKAQYDELCAYPEGTLTRVKLFRINVVREDINIVEYLHSDQEHGGIALKKLPVIRKVIGTK